MRIAQGRAVSLGYGTYVRSDRVAGLEPIEEGGGPGRRTRLWVEGAPATRVASRSGGATTSEGAIRSDTFEGREDAARSEVQRALLKNLLDTVEEIEPVLRRRVHDEAGWDLGRLEARIRTAFGVDAGD